MRRISLAIVGTVAVLILLFSYKTSLNRPLDDAATATIVSGGPSGSTGAGVSGAVAAPTTTTGQGPDPAATGDGGGSDGSPDPVGSSSSSVSTPSSGPLPSPSAASASTVVDGTAAGTPFGPVQVEVTIAGGAITDVQAVEYPTREQRDVQINNYAIPLLRQAVLNAQSAQVDVISGATYTSRGFLTSLQSALDAAHFGE